jgi:hypothetical protein
MVQINRRACLILGCAQAMAIEIFEREFRRSLRRLTNAEIEWPLNRWPLTGSL